MISSVLLSPQTCLLAALSAAPIYLWALRQVFWVELGTDSRRQHLFFGTVLGLLVLWLVRRDFDSGLAFHFIGMTAVTLLLDWPLAIVAGSLALAGLWLLKLQDAPSLAVNLWLQVLIPVGLAQAAALFVERFKPRNLFVYIFCSCFFPAALTALVCALLGFALLYEEGLLAMPAWLDEFAGYLWLVMFPEGFINGTVITALVVFCPDWLETFNRTRYLQAPWKEPQ